MSSAAFLLAPEQIPDKADQLEYHRWEQKKNDLINYRAVYKEINPKRGGHLGFLSNRGGTHEFNLGEFYTSDEIHELYQICQKYSGEYLAIWTYGRSITVLLMRSTESSPEIWEMSFRIDAPNNSSRDPEQINEFIKKFDDSVFSPDINALGNELNAPQMSVKNWFAAFGITGARDLKDKNISNLWVDFEQAALSLLRGETVDASLIQKINAKIDDENSLLFAKPYETIGDTARQITDAMYELAESIGRPESELWQKRYRAAEFYWDITESEDTLSRLTFGDDKKGVGNSAALGRLLMHYPPELYRDAIFLAQAGLEAESANGHAYVELFQCFAESAYQAGFTLAIFPSNLREDFRQAFGIEPFEDPPPPEHDWSAEVFLDIAGILEADSTPILEGWFDKVKSDGFLIRANADGSWQVFAFRAGEKKEHDVQHHELLTQAAKELNPRAIFPILNLPDLLQPGEWTEGAYAGEVDLSDKNKERTRVVKNLKNLPKPEMIADLKQVCREFPQQIAHPKNKTIAFSIALPELDETYLRLLMDDLKGEGCIEDYGEAWFDQQQLVAFSRTALKTAIFIRVLGDLPIGSRIGISTNEKFQYELNRQGISEIESCVLVEGESDDLLMEMEDDDEDDSFSQEYAVWGEALLNGIDINDDMVTHVVFEGTNRLFLEVDLDLSKFQSADLIKQYDQDILNLGMQPLGDMICDEHNMVFMRGYIASDRTTCVILMISISMEPIPEFYTRFADEASLTTTMNPMVSDHPNVGIYRQHIETKNVSELWQEHQIRVEQFQTDEGWTPEQIEATLAGLAKAVDEFLNRQFSMYR